MSEENTLNYSLDANGLSVPTLNEIVTYYENGFKNIYGENINVNSNTPDGQLINIHAQVDTDINEVITDLYNSFNIDLAEGYNLDLLCGLHAIARNSGTYTIVPITITVSQPLTLQGLDDNYNELEASNVFTISDNSGNQFYLISSYSFEEAGSETLQFRAQDIGAVQVSLETITNINTPQVGVISVINSSSVTQTGTDEETDEALKARFKQTYANGGRGAFENITAALLSLDGVTIAAGENNYTNNTSEHGTPAHSVWLIVQGGADDEIANTIYSTISAGCGMRGEEEYIIYTPQGTATTIKWDRPSYENLYIKFSTIKKQPDTVINNDYLKEQLINNLNLSLYQTIDVNQVSCILRDIQDDIIYTDIKLSVDNQSWVDIVTNTNYNYIFQLTTSNITITNN